LAHHGYDNPACASRLAGAAISCARKPAFSDFAQPITARNNLTAGRDPKPAKRPDSPAFLLYGPRLGKQHVRRRATVNTGVWQHDVRRGVFRTAVCGSGRRAIRSSLTNKRGKP
jgi:hypothetical protein